MTDKPKKSTHSEISSRVSEVEELKLAGRTRSYILRYCSEKWEVSDRTGDEYIAKASERIKEVNMASLQDNLGAVTSNLWDLYRVARNSQDTRQAHTVLMSIAKICGLDQMIVNHIIEDKRDLEAVSNEELDKLLEDALNGNH